jgi:hypothetical protein
MDECVSLSVNFFSTNFLKSFLEIFSKFLNSKFENEEKILDPIHC